ncbi:Fic family protein, partial [Streptomyces sp. NPDC051896]
SSGDFDGPAALIDRRSAELGLHTPAQRALESSLFIDEPLHQLALLSRQPRPELAFGEGKWAGYLDARAFARQYGDGELTVPFMTEIHQRLSRFTMPESGGRFTHSRPVGIMSKPFTSEERTLIEANPHLGYLPAGTVPMAPGQEAIEYRLSTPQAVKHELQALSDWYNNASKLPGTDPYRLAAELQQRYISIHPWVDYNGSSSRILMNWSLERDGLPASAPSDFDKDILSTTEKWTDMVRAGSDAFGERANRLAQLGDTADPIEVFGLEREHEVYQARGKSISDFTPGANFDIEVCRNLVKQLQDSPH